MNKKGFSLVELLAVIVILAVIALITSPLVLNVIEDSRQSAFKSSLNGIKKAIENDYSDNGFDHTREYYYGCKDNGVSTAGASDKKLRVKKSDGSYEEIAVSGEINGKGKGSVSATGTISVGIYTDKFCGIVRGNNISIQKIGEDISKADCINEIGTI